MIEFVSTLDCSCFKYFLDFRSRPGAVNSNKSGSLNYTTIMSSNYNYNNFSLEHLNSLTPVTPPEMSEEDLARELEELEFWSNTQFTFEVPPGVGLLDDEFQVSQTIDTKLEDQNINVVT